MYSLNDLLKESDKEEVVDYLCELGKKSESYFRSIALGLDSFTYQVDEYISQNTGIHFMTIPIDKNSEIIFTGSTDMLYYFSDFLSNFHYKFEIVSLGSNLFNSKKLLLKQLYLLNIHYEPNILNLFFENFSNDISFTYNICELTDLGKLLDFFKENNLSVHLSELVLVPVYYSGLSELDDYVYLKELFLYFNQVYILLTIKGLNELLLCFVYKDLLNILFQLNLYHIKFKIDEKGEGCVKSTLTLIPNLLNLLEFKKEDE